MWFLWTLTTRLFLFLKFNVKLDKILWRTEFKLFFLFKITPSYTYLRKSFFFFQATAALFSLQPAQKRRSSVQALSGFAQTVYIIPNWNQLPALTDFIFLLLLSQFLPFPEGMNLYTQSTPLPTSLFLMYCRRRVLQNYITNSHLQYLCLCHLRLETGSTCSNISLISLQQTDTPLTP